jgi:hypothetical protein
VPTDATLRAPTAANAASGLDWSGFRDALRDPNNVVRAFLEMTRPVPGMGIFTGMVADGINTYQDLSGISEEDAPYTKATVAIRDAVMIVNNAVGSIAALTQYVQDAATASVVGVEVDAVTVPFHEAVKGVKIYIDGVQIALDVLVMAEADWHAQRAPAGSASLNRWNGLLTNYQANVIGDGLTLTLDMIDEASAGFANGEVIKEVSKASQYASTVGRYVVQVFQGWYGVWGGNMPFMPTSGGAPGAAPAPAPAGSGPASRMIDRTLDAQLAVAVSRAVDASMVQRIGEDGSAGPALRRAAMQVILGEIGLIRNMYQSADEGISAMPEVANRIFERVNQLFAELTGSGPLVDQIHRLTDQMTQRITTTLDELVHMGAMGTSAQEKAQWLIQKSDEVLGIIDALTIPDVHVPHADDSTTGSSLINAGADAADRALQLALGTARDMLESAKAELRRPVISVRSQADDIASFAQVLQTHVQNATTEFNRRLQDFNAGIGRCRSATDFVNFLVSQVSGVIGVDLHSMIAEALGLWHQIPGLLDQGEAWATAQLASASGRRGATDEPTAAPAPAPAAEPPPGGGPPTPAVA